jgi:hypothetical protein
MECHADEAAPVTHGVCQTCFLKLASADGACSAILDEQTFTDLLAGNVVKVTGYWNGQQVDTFLYFSGRDFQTIRQAIDAAELQRRGRECLQGVA